MITHSFLLPSGNRIDIKDVGNGNRPNGILDSSDIIRINGVQYPLEIVESFPESAPVYHCSDHTGSWRYLMATLGVTDARGLNLSHVRRVFAFREEARYLSEQSNQTMGEREKIDTLIEESNRFSFPTITDMQLRGISSLIPYTRTPNWTVSECLTRSGMTYCNEGSLISERAQIRIGTLLNRRTEIIIYPEPSSE